MAVVNTYMGALGVMVSAAVRVEIVYWRHSPICRPGLYAIHESHAYRNSGVVYDAVVDDFGNLVRVNP